jgi:alcohol dehydrogenase (cytochrome c)
MRLTVRWPLLRAPLAAVAAVAALGSPPVLAAGPVPPQAALPTTAWLTNGGNLANQRYSPLTQINRDTVPNLRAEWRASLRSGLSPRAGNQAQPLVQDGIIYIMTGDNDAFAVSVETGAVLWEYRASIDPKRARPCCSWVGRGVGLGEGKVFVGQLDARLVALEQKTGKVVWSIQAEDPTLGYAIASAPLYYDGLVITGFAGSDLGTRGRLKAYEAKTGKLVWTFYTVPGPGEFGHDTWPEGSDVWKHGGAAIWQTPAIDPELGLVYFSTANPGPVLNGALRKGDNLFSVSMLAVEAKTGKYRWHFQQVHHDIWDYDSPNPVILFDAPYGGQMRKGIAQAAKTGWVYLLDRATGKPLLPIVETPVMQEPRQHTAATQPFPVGDAIVPQQLDMAVEGYELVNEGRVFTPYADKPVLWKPLAAVNWPPSSYDPESQLMYICAQDGSWGAVGGDPDYPVEPGALYSGSVVQRINAPRRGVFGAIDLKTNRIAWRQQWPEYCYSGSITTAGGLVFVGRNDGRLTALDKRNGNKLWEFQTDGGVNAPASTFEYKGTQYVVVLAGGTALAGSKRSDGLWLFSLKGTQKSLPRGSADPGAAPHGGPPGAGAASPTQTGNAAKGRDLYSGACIVCHGANGKGGTHGGAPLTPALTHDTIVQVVSAGRNQMPAFGSALQPQDREDLAAYVLELVSR